MANYVMQECNLQQEDGRKCLYPRLIGLRSMENDQLIEHISSTAGFSKGVVAGVLTALPQAMRLWMSTGYSVKIDGLGRFTPTLELRPGAEREESEQTGSHRNASSIRVGSISYRPDPAFVNDVNLNTRLERSATVKTIRSGQSRLTEDGRKAALMDFLAQHPYASLSDYMRLTGLKHSTAWRELRRWVSEPESPLTTVGKYSHKVYALKEDVEQTR